MSICRHELGVQPPTTPLLSKFKPWLRPNVNLPDQLAPVTASCNVNTEQPTRSTETKSKQRNDIDDRYLILETTGTW